MKKSYLFFDVDDYRNGICYKLYGQTYLQVDRIYSFDKGFARR